MPSLPDDLLRDQPLQERVLDESNVTIVARPAHVRGELRLLFPSIGESVVEQWFRGTWPAGGSGARRGFSFVEPFAKALEPSGKDARGRADRSSADLEDPFLSSTFDLVVDQDSAADPDGSPYELTARSFVGDIPFALGQLAYSDELFFLRSDPAVLGNAIGRGPGGDPPGQDIEADLELCPALVHLTWRNECCAPDPIVTGGTIVVNRRDPITGARTDVVLARARNIAGDALGQSRAISDRYLAIPSGESVQLTIDYATGSDPYLDLVQHREVIQLDALGCEELREIDIGNDSCALDPAPCTCEGEGQQCAGLLGTTCPAGSYCRDVDDDCDPRNGGADCIGVCSCSGGGTGEGEGEGESSDCPGNLEPEYGCADGTVDLELSGADLDVILRDGALRELLPRHSAIGGPVGNSRMTLLPSAAPGDAATTDPHSFFLPNLPHSRFDLAATDPAAVYQLFSEIAVFDNASLVVDGDGITHAPHYQVFNSARTGLAGLSAGERRHLGDLFEIQAGELTGEARIRGKEELTRELLFDDAQLLGDIPNVNGAHIATLRRTTIESSSHAAHGYARATLPGAPGALPPRVDGEGPLTGYTGEYRLWLGVPNDAALSRQWKLPTLNLVADNRRADDRVLRQYVQVHRRRDVDDLTRAIEVLPDSHHDAASEGALDFEVCVSDVTFHINSEVPFYAPQLYSETGGAFDGLDGSYTVSLGTPSGQPTHAPQSAKDGTVRVILPEGSYGSVGAVVTHRLPSGAESVTRINPISDLDIPCGQVCDVCSDGTSLCAQIDECAVGGQPARITGGVRSAVAGKSLTLMMNGAPQRTLCDGGTCMTRMPIDVDAEPTQDCGNTAALRFVSADDKVCELSLPFTFEREPLEVAADLSSCYPSTEAAERALLDGDETNGKVTVSGGCNATVSVEGAQADACNAALTVHATDKCLAAEATYSIRTDAEAPTATAGLIETCWISADDAARAAEEATSFTDNCADPVGALTTIEGDPDQCGRHIEVSGVDSCNLKSNAVGYEVKIDGAGPVLDKSSLEACYPSFEAFRAAVNSLPVIDECAVQRRVQWAERTCESGLAQATITLTDDCGHVAVEVVEAAVDLKDPSVSLPGGCYASFEDLERALVAADNCGVAQLDVVRLADTPCVDTVQATVTDQCGRVGRGVFDAPIDNQPPTFSGPAPDRCYADGDEVRAAIATNDNCAILGAPTVAVALGAGQCTQDAQVTVTDVCGNAVARSVPVRIDGDGPTLGDIPLGCAADRAAVEAAVRGAAQDDTCGIDNSSFRFTWSGDACNSAVAVTVSDLCGHVTSRTYDGLSFDNEAPVVTVAEMDPMCFVSASAAEAAIIAATSVTDNCAPTPAPEADVSGGCSAIASVRAEDQCGNVASESIDGIIIDNEDPTLVTTALIDIVATGAPVTLPADSLGTAVDECGAELEVVSCTPYRIWFHHYDHPRHECSIRREVSERAERCVIDPVTGAVRVATDDVHGPNGGGQGRAWEYEIELRATDPCGRSAQGTTVVRVSKASETDFCVDELSAPSAQEEAAFDSVEVGAQWMAQLLAAPTPGAVSLGERIDALQAEYGAGDVGALYEAQALVLEAASNPNADAELAHWLALAGPLDGGVMLGAIGQWDGVSFAGAGTIGSQSLAQLGAASSSSLAGTLLADALAQLFEDNLPLTAVSLLLVPDEHVAAALAGGAVINAALVP